MKNYILITLMLILVSCASENSEWEKTLTENSIEAYKIFIEKYPDGQFASIAYDSLISVEYKKTIKENTVKSYENFLIKYPNSKFSLAMNDSLEYWAGNIIWLNSTNGYFLDIRDKQKYKIIKIDKQIWMAENLKFKTSRPIFYDHDTNYYKKYGCLYTWKEALQVCPSGWHLPSKAEYKILINYLGGSSVAGKKLKNAHDWQKDSNGKNYGNNISGFNALPGGYYHFFGGYQQGGYHGKWWSSTPYSPYDPGYSTSLELEYSSSESYLADRDYTRSYSVRCIKD